MLVCLVLIVMFTKSFGQSVNCSSIIGYNSSTMGLVTNATDYIDNVPFPYGAYPVVYSNGSYILYQATWNISRNSSNVNYFGSGIYNISQSDNSNVDCYMTVQWQNGPLNGQKSCYAYSVLSNPFSIFGCYDYGSSMCPTSCASQYVTAPNHTWFGTYYLNPIDHMKTKNYKDDEKALITTDTKLKQSGIATKSSIPCDAIIGYNSSFLEIKLNWVNVYAYPILYYGSIYSNGTYVQYNWKGSYSATGIYNISQSGNDSNVDCYARILWQDGLFEGQTFCLGYSLTMNGIGAVGCFAQTGAGKEPCPTSCDAQYVVQGNHLWSTQYVLNSLTDDNPK